MAEKAIHHGELFAEPWRIGRRTMAIFSLRHGDLTGLQTKKRADEVENPVRFRRSAAHWACRAHSAPKAALQLFYAVRGGTDTKKCVKFPTAADRGDTDTTRTTAFSVCSGSRPITALRSVESVRIGYKRTVIATANAVIRTAARLTIVVIIVICSCFILITAESIPTRGKKSKRFLFRRRCRARFEPRKRLRGIALGVLVCVCCCLSACGPLGGNRADPP